MAQGEPSSDTRSNGRRGFRIDGDGEPRGCRCRLSPHAQDTNRNAKAEVEAPLENNYDDDALN